MAGAGSYRIGLTAVGIAALLMAHGTVGPRSRRPRRKELRQPQPSSQPARSRQPQDSRLPARSPPRARHRIPTPRPRRPTTRT